jgi:hypothetical protein
MMLSNIIELSCRGIVCKSDYGLYEKREEGPLYLLSIYGAPQQTKAMLSSYASYRTITASTGETFHRSGDPIRFKTYPIGYGKSHGLLYIDGIGKKIVAWLTPEEKIARFAAAISKRKIPYNLRLLPEIIKLLLDNEIIEELGSWGGIGGYLCNWGDDDYICDLICSEILGRKRMAA